jgi:phosphate transport system substrate-binding protein
MNPFCRPVCILISLIIIVTGCRDRDKQGRLLDTPTSGSVKIAVDESLRPLLEAEVNTFEGLYPRAEIHASYYPEAEAIDALMNDSVRLAVVTRRFTEEEKAYFKNIKITPTILTR